MKVSVEISGYFKKYLDELEFEIELPEKFTVEELIGKLGLPEEQVGFAAVDNKKVDMKYTLSSSQRVGIFPYILGG